jgi:hypothetical protein
MKRHSSNALGKQDIMAENSCTSNSTWAGCLGLIACAQFTKEQHLLAMHLNRFLWKP